MEVVRALRAVDARAVQYATWVTEAWRTLQWGEQTARLLWEMLMLFSYNGESSSRVAGVRWDGSMAIDLGTSRSDRPYRSWSSQMHARALCMTLACPRLPACGVW